MSLGADLSVPSRAWHTVGVLAECVQCPNTEAAGRGLHRGSSGKPLRCAGQAGAEGLGRPLRSRCPRSLLGWPGVAGVELGVG